MLAWRFRILNTALDHMRSMLTDGSRPPLGAVATIVSATLLVGCSVTDSERGSSGNAGSSSTTKTTNQSAIGSHWMTSKPVRVDLLSLDRVAPKLVLARFRLTNFGSQNFIVDHRLGAEYNTDVSGMTLVDVAAQKNYYPFYAADGKCVCSIFGATDDAEIGVDPQQSISLFAYFPAPPHDYLGVRVPEVPPFVGVSVGSTKRPVPTPEGQPKRNPFKLDLNAPFVKPIVSVVESMNGAKTIEEDNNTREVTLSAGVLFELNESRLTGKAQGVLKDVAQDIEQADPEVVHIDGYTDSSGSPSINIPLSEARAESVQETLHKLIDSSEVSFETAGHGADDPVAPNDTAEGRQKNRRVTITYTK